MDLVHAAEQLSEEEWDDDEVWLDEDSIAIAAGQVAEAAQRAISQPDGLNKAFLNTIHSIRLFAYSAFVKTARLEEQSPADLSEMQNVMPRNVGKFAQQLISDPQSESSQSAIRDVTDYLSTRHLPSDDVRQSHNELDSHRATLAPTLQESPKSISTALYRTFYTSTDLPCTCSAGGIDMCLSEKYVCSLRLDGHHTVFGNEKHWFFDSVIAGRDDASYQWTPIQFQLPKESRAARVGLPADHTSIKDCSSTNENSPIELKDFCQVLRWRIRCSRIHITKNLETHRFDSYHTGHYEDVFPQRGAPVLLSTALVGDGLSARHKIFLAYAISKAFWQYYDSEWMNVEWSLNTVQLLQTESHESKAPFLKINSVECENPTLPEHVLVGTDGVPHLHHHPYILNLGLLLVQLGSITSDRATITPNNTKLQSTIQHNDLYISCCTAIADREWPMISLPHKEKGRYQRIVEACFPSRSKISQPLFQKHLDPAGRQLALKDYVVRPLFELLRDMVDPETTRPQPPKIAQSSEPHVLSKPENLRNKGHKTQSDLASDWLNNIKNSPLHNHVTAHFKNLKPQKMSRPKIAIIDTGFDSGARFLDRKLELRLNMFYTREAEHNWKDFWRSEAIPKDEDGHGTAMLSIIHRIAPFADICVARIASGGNDLKENPKLTSEKLAEAITWAAKEQRADILSLSLGWEQEQCVDENWIVSNAISDARAHLNQNLLIFAAASNLGGSKHELFPAKDPMVFSIRATDTKGKHEDFNPALPESGDKVYGTLGLSVPVANRGGLGPSESTKTGTSVATAIAAGLAAIVIGHVKTNDKTRPWAKIRTFGGFQNLLHELSTEPDMRKRFITLDNHADLESFEGALDSASRRGR